MLIILRFMVVLGLVMVIFAGLMVSAAKVKAPPCTCCSTSAPGGK